MKRRERESSDHALGALHRIYEEDIHCRSFITGLKLTTPERQHVNSSKLNNIKYQILLHSIPRLYRLQWWSLNVNFLIEFALLPNPTVDAHTHTHGKVLCKCLFLARICIQFYVVCVC